MVYALVGLFLTLAFRYYKRLDVVSILEGEYIGTFSDNLRKSLDEVPIPDIPDVEIPGISFTTPKRRRRRKIIRKTGEILKNFYYLWNQSSRN